MSKTLQRKNEAGEVTSSFTLHVQSGNFRDGECIVLLGENGTGENVLLRGGTFQSVDWISTTIYSLLSYSNNAFAVIF